MLSELIKGGTRADRDTAVCIQDGRLDGGTDAAAIERDRIGEECRLLDLGPLC